MKDPIRILQDEHTVLLEAIITGRALQKTIDNTVYYKLMHDFIIFIRNFTEIYHYPKEENILFPLLQNRSAAMTKEFIHEISDNHEDFKSMIAEIENHYMIQDSIQLRKTMNNYFEVLAEHIKRENKIILSAADKILSITEKKNIYDQFEKTDKKNGEKEELKKELYKIKELLND